jgi:hypothetical protein
MVITHAVDADRAEGVLAESHPASHTRRVPRESQPGQAIRSWPGPPDDTDRDDLPAGAGETVQEDRIVASERLLPARGRLDLGALTGCCRRLESTAHAFR